MTCLSQSTWGWLLGKLTWYWGIHHRLLPVSSGSDLVLAVWFSFLAGSCIFFCLALLLQQVCFVPPTCWRREETEGQEKGKEITVHYHVIMYTAKKKTMKEHWGTSVHQEGNEEGSRTKRSSPLQNSLNTPLLGLLRGPVLCHYPLEYPGQLAVYFHRT